MKPTGPTDPNITTLIRTLRKTATAQNAPIWKRIADDLSKSHRSRIIVNLSKISRYSSPGDVVVIPGKVLASGELAHRLKIGAISFSENAKSKIVAAGGTCVSLIDLIDNHPDGSGLRILK